MILDATVISRCISWLLVMYSIKVTDQGYCKRITYKTIAEVLFPWSRDMRDMSARSLAISRRVSMNMQRYE